MTIKESFMIRICEHCSNINLDQLKEAVGEKNIQVGCIENCAAYETKAYGFINNELVVEQSSEEWIKKALNK